MHLALRAGHRPQRRGDRARALVRGLGQRRPLHGRDAGLRGHRPAHMDAGRGASRRGRHAAHQAVMPVHLYGHPADMGALNELAAAHDLLVVEGAAEAHGAAVHGTQVGGLGRVGAFSFYANKIITTGEGGMLTTDDGELAARCRMLRDHAMPPAQRYWHDEVGFNYRLTNLQAAVGVAQLEQIDTFLARKRHIAAQYTAALAGVPGLVPPVELPGYTNVYWMVSVLVTDAFPLTRDELMAALRARDIDSRPFFHPLDTLPPYRAATPCPWPWMWPGAASTCPAAPS
ncbi:MAG: DegT/DnrJ/EryC1/StrS family aminotransferase [Caldilineaceae bacterium]